MSEITVKDAIGILNNFMPAEMCIEKLKGCDDLTSDEIQAGLNTLNFHTAFSKQLVYEIKSALNISDDDMTKYAAKAVAVIIEPAAEIDAVEVYSNEAAKDLGAICYPNEDFN